MTRTYDAIVVGARCAGATTAMLLAREGLDVLLVDRAIVPSDIPHGHFIHRGGPQQLDRWGLYERVLATGCPPVTRFTSDLGDGPLTGEDLEVDGVAFGVAPRRSALDAILAEAAVEAGAELRDGFAVLDYVLDGDRITGIRGRDTRSGATVQERARIVVGADGRHSMLARTVEAPLTLSAPTATCWFFSYFSGVPDQGLEMHLNRHRRIVFGFPTNDGLYGLYVGWPADELPAVKRDVEGALLAVVDGVPALADRVRAGRREERLSGATSLPNFIRRPWGRGWALVGDAGCHKDPYLALGVCDALRDAELLAGALVEGLGGEAPMAEALAGYERRRDAATTMDWQMNLAAASLLPPPPETLVARAAVRGDREATTRFLLEREGLLPAVAA